MSPRIEIAQYLPSSPGYFALELTFEGEKPVAYRKAIVAWALEADTFAPYPITLEGLIVENVAILRPDGAVDMPCNAFYDDLQEWLEEAHAEHVAERARPAGNNAASEYIAGQCESRHIQSLLVVGPSPARLTPNAALDSAREVATKAARSRKVSP